jgi:hypothetical protein
LGLTSPIAECLGAEDETFTSFHDPIVEGMMIPVKPVIDICCIIIEADADLLLTVPDLVVELSANLDIWIENPLSLIELAGLEIPSPFNGFDLTGEIAIDPEIVLPQLEVTIGLMLIPLKIVVDWCVGLTNLELPSIPTLDDLKLLIPELGYQVPEAAIECIAKLPLIPMEAVAAAISDPGSIC